MAKSKTKKKTTKGAARAELKDLKKQIKALEAVKKKLSAGAAKRRKETKVWASALEALSDAPAKK